MTPSTRTKKSARRIALTLLAVLATIGAGAFAYAAAVKPDFTIAASPALVTVTQGQTASYTVTTQRQSFADPIAFSVTGLPAATKATFSTSPLTSSTATTTLKVVTNHQGTTPVGTYTLTITGTAGRTARSTTVKLGVQSAAQPSFALNLTPTSRTVSKGQDATYSISVVRSGGFAGPVTLGVSGLPSGASHSFDVNPVPSDGTSSILSIDTDSASTGTFVLTITGTGSIGPRTTTATLVVNQQTSFRLAGSVPSPLAPGQSRPIDVAITNPYSFGLKVTALSVSVADFESNPGCRPLRNFAAKQIAAASLPLLVPAGQTRTLEQLGVHNRSKPQLAMLETNTLQDVCKGAQVKLQYSAVGTK